MMKEDFVAEANQLGPALDHFRLCRKNGNEEQLQQATSQLREAVERADAVAKEGDALFLRLPREQQGGYLRLIGLLVGARQELLISEIKKPGPFASSV